MSVAKEYKVTGFLLAGVLIATVLGILFLGCGSSRATKVGKHVLICADLPGESSTENLPQGPGIDPLYHTPTRPRAPVVYFDFDRYAIRDDQAQTLDRYSEYMGGIPDGFTVIGSCDERGTHDYNLALGYRRARAVVGHMQRFGVDPTRVQVISLGKEHATGRDEAGWQEDRKVVFRREE